MKKLLKIGALFLFLGTVLGACNSKDTKNEKGKQKFKIGIGLPKDCVINVSQTLVVDRSRLVTAIGDLPAHLLARVDDGLRLVLSL